jgi:hypothetical protein
MTPHFQVIETGVVDNGEPMDFWRVGVGKGIAA